MNEKTNVSEYGYNGASLKLDPQMFREYVVQIGGLHCYEYYSCAFVQPSWQGC